MIPREFVMKMNENATQNTSDNTSMIRNVFLYLLSLVISVLRSSAAISLRLILRSMNALTTAFTRQYAPDIIKAHVESP